MEELKPNEGKELNIEVDGKVYSRFPIRTLVITEHDDIVEICKKYTKPYLEEEDKLFISERIVAISQGRAFHIDDIKPSLLANLLSRFVHKSPHGIGLRSPWTMEIALQEAGSIRMLFASLLSVITKPFGIKGIFYKVVGNNINAIDGPCDYTIPPYNNYAKLGPLKPNKVAREISEALGNEVVIIDANDLGVEILGKSNEEITREFCLSVFRDNPLGQGDQQTPLCIVRYIK